MAPALSETDTAVLAAMAGAGEDATPRRIADDCGLRADRLSRVLRRLRERGLVEGGERTPRLSPAGRSAAAPPPAAAGAFEEALEEVWTPWAGAQLRLGADAVFARHLLPGRDSQPALVTYGATKAGKTAAGEFLCAAFGWDPAEHRFEAYRMSRGEMLGRRHQEPGGWVFEPGAPTRLPLVVLDELGLAEPEVKKAAFAFLEGHRRVRVGSDVVEVCPLPWLVFNPRSSESPTEFLPEPYWRRCLALNTDYYAGAPGAGSLGERLRSFYAAPRPALLCLEGASAPGDALADDAYRYIVGWERPSGRVGGLRGISSDEGWALSEPRAVEACVLGRAARYGLGASDGLEAVALAVVYDVATLAETVPGRVADPDAWRLLVPGAGSALAGAPGFEAFERASAALERARAGRERRADAAAMQRRAERAAEAGRAEVDDVSLAGAKAAAVTILDDAARAIERVPAHERARAAGLRKQLRAWRDKVRAADGPERLRALADASAPALAAASELASRLGNEAAERARAVEAERARSRHAKAAVAAGRKADAAAQGASRRRRRELEALAARRSTKAGENVPARLLAAGVVEAEAYVVDYGQPGFWGRLAGAPAGRATRRRYRDRSGTTWQAHQLARWEDAGTKAALAAAMVALGADEASGRGSVVALQAPPRPRALAAGSLTGAELYGAAPRG